MQSVAIIANNYLILGRILQILIKIRRITDDRVLYKEASRLQIKTSNIIEDYKLNWYEPIINPNLTLELYNFFAYRNWWKNYFINDCIEYHENNRTKGFNFIDYLFEQMDDIALCLDKIMHIDYNKMRQDNRDFFVELNQYILKPERVERMAEQCGVDFFDYLDAIDV